MKKRILFMLLLICLIMIPLSGCLPGDGTYTPGDPAGFFWGIWHGWIAPISLIGGLFNKNIRVYEVINTGWWYDFGFYMAIISGFGSISFVRHSKKKDD